MTIVVETAQHAGTELVGTVGYIEGLKWRTCRRQNWLIVCALRVAMIAAILESRSLGSGAFVMLPRVWRCPRRWLRYWRGPSWRAGRGSSIRLCASWWFQYHVIAIQSSSMRYVLSICTAHLENQTMTVAHSSLEQHPIWEAVLRSWGSRFEVRGSNFEFQVEFRVEKHLSCRAHLHPCLALA